MDKEEHGQRLRAAMARRGLDRNAVAAVTNRKPRTVTNWTSGETMPSDAEREALRRLLGPYDDPGDAVEVAIRSSDLTEDRRYQLLGVYKRLAREQAEGMTG